MGFNPFKRGNSVNNARIRKHKYEVEMEMMKENSVKTAMEAMEQTVKVQQKNSKMLENMLNKYEGWSDEGKIAYKPELNEVNGGLSSVLINFISSNLSDKHKGTGKLLINAFKSDPQLSGLLDMGINHIIEKVIGDISKSGLKPEQVLEQYQKDNQ
jgi:hypothetical protein